MKTGMCGTKRTPSEKMSVDVASSAVVAVAGSASATTRKTTGNAPSKTCGRVRPNSLARISSESSAACVDFGLSAAVFGFGDFAGTKSEQTSWTIC